MKPFAYNSELIACQRTYNYRICRARIVAKNACLWMAQSMKVSCTEEEWHADMHVDYIPHVIAFTYVLYNVCGVHHEDVNDTWLQNSEGEYD